jgi:hypothetical protein
LLGGYRAKRIGIRGGTERANRSHGECVTSAIGQALYRIGRNANAGNSLRGRTLAFAPHSVSVGSAHSFEKEYNAPMLRPHVDQTRRAPRPVLGCRTTSGPEINFRERSSADGGEKRTPVQQPPSRSLRPTARDESPSTCHADRPAPQSRLRGCPEGNTVSSRRFNLRKTRTPPASTPNGVDGCRIGSCQPTPPSLTTSCFQPKTGHLFSSATAVKISSATQEEHHLKTTFEEEYRKLLLEAGIEFARYLP